MKNATMGPLCPFLFTKKATVQWCQVRKYMICKCTSLLYLSTIFKKSACNKVNFFWSTFTWNEVVLRSNVSLRYFHFVGKYFVTFSHLFNFA